MQLENFEPKNKKNTPKLSPTGIPLEQFDFYQNRFKAMAARHNERSKAKGVEAAMNRLADKNAIDNDKKTRPKQVTEKYIIQEQAERENAEFNRQYDIELKRWQESLKPVVAAFKAKRDYPEGEGKKHRILILSLGGGMRGPYGAGQVIGLNEMELTAEKVDILYGISAGAADLAYYAGGPENTKKGASIYSDECNSPEFLSFHPKRINNMMRAVDVVGGAMRKGEKALNVDAIRNLPGEVYVQVTTVEGHEAEMINVKTATPDIISAFEASMNVPILNAPGVKVNGKEYIDGGFDPLPIQKLINKFHPTDILILPNTPFKRIEEFPFSPDWTQHLPRSGSLGSVKKFFQIASDLRHLLEDFSKREGVNIGMLWPPDRGLDVLDIDSSMIEIGVKDAAMDTIKQFGEEPRDVELYVPEKFREQKAA